MTDIQPIVYVYGTGVKACLQSNESFIRQCHERMIEVPVIAALIGIKTKTGGDIPRSSLYSSFSSARVGRSHLGFKPLCEARLDTRIDAVTRFKSRAAGTGHPNFKEVYRVNAALIKEMHILNFTYSEIGEVLGFGRRDVGADLKVLGLQRSAFDLPPLSPRDNMAAKQAAPARKWSPAEDAQIRRGHACGFPAASVAALCRRSGLEVTRRADVLGLGGWIAQQDPKVRQALAREYTPQHAPSELSEA